MLRSIKNNYNTPHIIWGVFLSFLISNLLNYIINPHDQFLKVIIAQNFLMFSISILTGVLIYLILFFVLNFTIKTINKKDLLNKEISYYFIMTNIVVLITMLLLLLLETFIYEHLFHDYFAGIDQVNFDLRIYFVVNLIVATMFNSYYSVLYFFNKWTEKERLTKELLIETHQLKEVALQTELQMYKMQLDPHFLFNSFSILTHLIDTDKLKAQLYLDNVSKVYRYLLLNSKKDVVKIATELDLITAYYQLLKIRHQNSIHLTIEINQTNQKLGIAPVTLQLLVENAVKHNKYTADKPLEITITDTEKGFILVKNNLQKINLPQESMGLGLENIMQRYHILSDQVPIFYEDQESFIVKIPLLHF